MKRKAIEAIPLVTRTLGETKEEYTGFSQLLTIKEEKILILDLYKTRRITEPTELPPAKRYVTNGKDFETYTPVPREAWGKAGLEECWGAPSIHFPKGADQAIFEVLPKPKWSYKDTAVERLRDNESDIKSKRNSKNRQYHQNAIDRRIALVGAFPKGIDRWYKSLFKHQHYIFYETLSPKKAVGTCSSCTTTIEYNRSITKPKHDESGTCPMCKANIIYKAKGRKWRIETKKKAIVMQKTPEGFASRYILLEYTASEYGETIKSREVARVTYNGQRTRHDYSYGYNDKLNWTDGNTNGVTIGTGYLYTKNLTQVLDGTKFKYCAIGLLQRHTDGPINQERYLEQYESAPFLEYMVKMGLYRLANEYVANSWSANINSNEKKPEDILKISREKINRLININGGLESLHVMQLEEATGRILTDQELYTMERYQIKSKTLIETTEYTTVRKLLTYARKQLAGTKTGEHFVSDWLDYIRMCIAAGLELNETLMFPRNLKAEHDKRAAEFKAMQNSEKNEQYQNLRRQYIKDFSFTSGNYTVIVPDSLESIIKEGNEQHHCVGTYVDKVAKGTTCILFVREKDKPDQPFYTMEIKGKEVTQCRGKYNVDPSLEIGKKMKQFVAKFQKHITRNISSKETIQIPA